MNGVALEGSGRPKGSNPQERESRATDDSKAHVAVNMFEESGRLCPGVAQVVAANGVGI